MAEISCPSCKKVGENGIKDSRASQLHGMGDVVRRRRFCDCGHRWTTFEVTEEALHDATYKGIKASGVLDAVRALVHAPKV